MKTIGQVIGIICVIHVLALLGGVGWLLGTGRLDKQRVTEVREIFVMSVQEETKQAEEIETVAVKAREQAQILEASVSGSPTEKIEEERDANELELRQLERTRREIESLRANLHLTRQRMERQKKESLAEKQAIEKQLKEIENRLNTKGFKKAVAMMEALPAKQVKMMFIDMMSNNQIDQVVEYLEAMQPRKAAAVLGEFKKSDEVSRVVELTERLRARGSDLVKKTETKA